MIKKKCLIALLSLLTLTACSTETSETGSEIISQTSEISSDISDDTVSETVVTEPIWEPSVEDKEIALWLKNYLVVPEYFLDIEDYQYYARAIGQDKDFFLNPDMWEVFYNSDINRNRDINGLDIYLVRLNPNKLLEVYAENNSCTVDELCKKISVSKEQLYYNWGYNPASINYYDNHKENKVEYSKDEQMIFGIYNSESRSTVMRTHLIVYDHNEHTITYRSQIDESYEIYRRDILKSYSSNAKLYSEFTEDEKNPAFKVNGIGIRAVIPLSIPNAFINAADTGLGDENVSVMINTSPFSYGCTDEDRLDLEAIYKYIDENT